MQPKIAQTLLDNRTQSTNFVLIYMLVDFMSSSHVYAAEFHCMEMCNDNKEFLISEKNKTKQNIKLSFIHSGLAQNVNNC